MVFLYLLTHRVASNVGKSKDECGRRTHLKQKVQKGYFQAEWNIHGESICNGLNMLTGVFKIER